MQQVAGEHFIRQEPAQVLSLRLGVLVAHPNRTACVHNMHAPASALREIKKRAKSKVLGKHHGFPFEENGKQADIFRRPFLLNCLRFDPTDVVAAVSHYHKRVASLRGTKLRQTLVEGVVKRRFLRTRMFESIRQIGQALAQFFGIGRKPLAEHRFVIKNTVFAKARVS